MKVILYSTQPMIKGEKMTISLSSYKKIQIELALPIDKNPMIKEGQRCVLQTKNDTFEVLTTKSSNLIWLFSTNYSELNENVNITVYNKDNLKMLIYDETTFNVQESISFNTNSTLLLQYNTLISPLTSIFMYDLATENGNIPSISFRISPEISLPSIVECLFIELGSNYQFSSPAVATPGQISWSLPLRKFLIPSLSSNPSSLNSLSVKELIYFNDKSKLLQVKLSKILNSPTYIDIPQDPYVSYHTNKETLKTYLQPSIISTLEKVGKIEFTTNFNYTEEEILQLLTWAFGNSKQSVNEIIQIAHYGGDNLIYCNISDFDYHTYDYVLLKYPLAKTETSPFSIFLPETAQIINVGTTTIEQEKSVIGIFSGWDCIFENINSQQNSFQILYELQSVNFMSWSSPAKIITPSVTVKLGIDYDYFHDFVTTKNLIKVLSSPEIQFSPQKLQYPATNSQILNISASEGFSILNSLNYSLYNVILNTVDISSNCTENIILNSGIETLLLSWEIANTSSAFSKAYDGIVEVKINAVEKYAKKELEIVLYSGKFLLENNQTVLKVDGRQPQTATTLIVDTSMDTELISNDIFRFKYVNRTNLLQESATISGDLILGKINAEQFGVLSNAEYSNHYCIFEGDSIIETSLSLISSTSYTIQCQIPTEIQVLFNTVSTVKSIQIFAKDSTNKKILITQFINPKFETYTHPVIKLSSVSNSVLLKNISESVKNIQIISGDITRANSRCKFISRNTQKAVYYTFPVITMNIIQCPFNFSEIPQTDINILRFYDLSLEFSTGILDEISEISITKNSLKQNIIYDAVESAIKNEAIIISNTALEIHLAIDQRVKSVADTDIIVNLNLALKNSTESDLLSQIFFNENFDTNSIAITSQNKNQLNLTISKITQFSKSSSSGVNIHASIDSKNAVYANSTALQLCIILKPEYSLFWALENWYLIERMSGSLIPQITSISSLVGKFTLETDLNQIIKINSGGDDIKLAISVSVYSEQTQQYYNQEIISVELSGDQTVKNTKDIIKFSINPNILEGKSMPFPITINFIVEILSCQTWNSSLVIWDNSNTCPQISNDLRLKTSKIFWGWDFTNQNCLSNFTDMNILQIYKDKNILSYTKIREDIILNLGPQLQIISTFNITSSVVLYSYSSINKTENLIINSAQELSTDSSNFLRCSQTLSSGENLTTVPQILNSNSLNCPILLLNKNEKSILQLVYYFNEGEKPASNPIIVQSFTFKILKYYPLLSLKNGGGRFTVEIDPQIMNFNSQSNKENSGIERIKNLGCEYGGSIIFAATILANSKLTCPIPPLNKDGIVTVDLISLDSSQKLVGDSLMLKYCAFQDCKDEYLWKYILIENNAKIYEIRINEGLNSIATRSNTSTYCLGETLEYSGNYQIEVSINNGETWVRTNEGLTYIQSNLTAFSVLKTSTSSLYIPGNNRILATTNYKIDQDDAIVEVKTRKGNIILINSTTDGSLDVNFTIDSKYFKSLPDFVKYRIGIKSKGIYTEWIELNSKANAILHNVSPRTLWSIQTSTNASYIHLNEYLPVIFTLDVTQFNTESERLYCVFTYPSTQDNFKIIQSEKNNNQVVWNISNSSDLITKFIDEEIYFTVTKDLNVLNTESRISIMTRPIPEITSINLDSIGIENTSLSGISSLDATLTGRNFREDTLKISKLFYSDVLGRGIIFNTKYSRFIFEDTVKIRIPNPLSVQNLLIPNRFTISSGVRLNSFNILENPILNAENVNINYTTITFDSSNSATIEPNLLNITFRDPFPYTEKIEGSLLHYLKGNYTLEIVEYHKLKSDQTLLGSITVKLPIISTPMEFEMYFKPILDQRIVFEKINFNYKINETQEIITASNSSIISNKVVSKVTSRKNLITIIFL